MPPQSVLLRQTAKQSYQRRRRSEIHSSRAWSQFMGQSTMRARSLPVGPRLQMSMSACAESARGISPEPLTDPDVILSHHPARAIARRLPPSAEIAGSSRFDPVGPRSTTMTHPLRSVGIAPLRRYYEAVRPSPAHRYFQPHGLEP